MNANQVRNMVTRVPTIRKSVAINSFKANQGDTFRMLFTGLCLTPIVMCADLNGGIAKLGFSTGTTMQSEYKMRPDYATGTLFAAERKDVPTFSNL